jgi:hypothetical protein
VEDIKASALYFNPGVFKVVGTPHLGGRQGTIAPDRFDGSLELLAQPRTCSFRRIDACPAHPNPVTSPAAPILSALAGSSRCDDRHRTPQGNRSAAAGLPASSGMVHRVVNEAWLVV